MSRKLSADATAVDERSNALMIEVKDGVVLSAVAPHGSGWEDKVKESNKRVERLGTALKQSEKDTNTRRGNFTSGRYGYSYGGGQTVSPFTAQRRPHVDSAAPVSNHGRLLKARGRLPRHHGKSFWGANPSKTSWITRTVGATDRSDWA